MSEQMTLEEALAYVESGADPRWIDTCTKIVRHLASLGGRFTTDDVWDLLEETGLSTKEPRAMGAVVRKLSSDRVIVGAGEYWVSRRPECHQRPVKVWCGTHQAPCSNCNFEFPTNTRYSHCPKCLKSQE